MTHERRPAEILLVEDNAGDVRLTMEAMREGRLRTNVSVVSDGEQALAFLKREGKYEDAPRPDLILLDLNLPRMDGRDVLQEIKRHEGLRSIPVIVLTTSSAPSDIAHCYDLHANCYITKPVDLDAFIDVVKSIEGFWLSVVRLSVGAPP
jgi:CheY-like chemotaxis protein